MTPLSLNIADQQFESHVESGYHQPVARQQFAAARLLGYILVFTQIPEHKSAIRVVSYLYAFAGLEIGRIDTLHHPEIRYLAVFGQILRHKWIIGVAKVTGYDIQRCTSGLCGSLDKPEHTLKGSNAQCLSRSLLNSQCERLALLGILQSGAEPLHDFLSYPLVNHD